MITSYNASVFKITTSNDWNLNIVEFGSEEFFKMNATMNITDPASPMPYWNMSNAEWSGAYSRRYVSGRGDLYLFIDRVAYEMPHPNQTTSLGSLRSERNGSQTVTATLVRESADWILLPNQDASGLSPISAHVNHGFSTKLKNRSRVQISLYFMIIVVVFNVFKLAVMALVLITDRSAYLVTIGDAAASFLKRPDPCTQGKCVLGKEEFFVTMGMLPLHPVSTEDEAKDLHLRSTGTWLPKSRPYLFSINRHGKVIYTML